MRVMRGASGAKNMAPRILVAFLTVAILKSKTPVVDCAIFNNMDIKIFKTDDMTALPTSECRAGLRVRMIDSNSKVDIANSKIKKSTATKPLSELSIQQMRAQITRLQKEKEAEIAHVVELGEQNNKLKADCEKIYGMYTTKSNEVKQLGTQYDKLKEYTLDIEDHAGETEEELKQWKEKYDNLEKKVDTYKEPVTEKTESLRVTIELLREKNQELEAQIAAQQSQAELEKNNLQQQLNSAVDQLKANRSETESAHTQMQTMLTQARQKLIDEFLHEKNNITEEFEQQKNILQDELRSQKQNVKERQAGHQDALSQLQTLTQRCQNAEKAREEMAEALANAESEKVQLYRRQKREVEALQAKYKATDYERRLATLAYEKSVMCKERDSVLKARHKIAANAALNRQFAEQATVTIRRLQNERARIQVEQTELEIKKAQLDELAATTKRNRDEWEISSTKQRDQMEKDQALSSIQTQALQLQLTSALRDQMESLSSFEVLEKQTRAVMGLETQVAHLKEDLQKNAALQLEAQEREDARVQDIQQLQDSLHSEKELVAMLQKEKERGIEALKERADAVLDLEHQRDQLAKQGKEREDARVQDIQQLQDFLHSEKELVAMLQKEKERGIEALKERADAVLDLEKQRDQLAKQSKEREDARVQDIQQLQDSLHSEKELVAMLQKEKERGIEALKERADAVLDLEHQRDQLAKQIGKLCKKVDQDSMKRLIGLSTSANTKTQDHDQKLKDLQDTIKIHKEYILEFRQRYEKHRNRFVDKNDKSVVHHPNQQSNRADKKRKELEMELKQRTDECLEYKKQIQKRSRT